MTNPAQLTDNAEGTSVDQGLGMQPRKSYRKPGFTKLETGGDTLSGSFPAVAESTPTFFLVS